MQRINQMGNATLNFYPPPFAYGASTGNRPGLPVQKSTVEKNIGAIASLAEMVTYTAEPTSDAALQETLLAGQSRYIRQNDQAGYWNWTLFPGVMMNSVSKYRTMQTPTVTVAPYLCIVSKDRPSQGILGNPQGDPYVPVRFADPLDIRESREVMIDMRFLKLTGDTKLSILSAL